MTATVPGAGTDGRGLMYRFANLNVPLEVWASYIPDLSNNGYAHTTGLYFGPTVYQGEDSGDSRVIPVSGRRNHAVQVTSAQTTAYSVQVEGSLDGQTWSNVQTAFVADSLYNFTGLYKFVRFNVTLLTLTGGYNSANPYGLKILYLAQK